MHADSPELALADFEAVLALDPDCVDALYYKGALLAKLSLLDDAIDDFTRVLQLEPDHINASYARAACRNKKGDYNQAIGAVVKRARDSGARRAPRPSSQPTHRVPCLHGAEDYKYALDRDTSSGTTAHAAKRRGWQSRLSRLDLQQQQHPDEQHTQHTQHTQHPDASGVRQHTSEWDSGGLTPGSVTSDAHTTALLPPLSGGSLAGAPQGWSRGGGGAALGGSRLAHAASAADAGAEWAPRHEEQLAGAAAGAAAVAGAMVQHAAGRGAVETQQSSRQGDGYRQQQQAQAGHGYLAMHHGMHRPPLPAAWRPRLEPRGARSPRWWPPVLLPRDCRARPRERHH